MASSRAKQEAWPKPTVVGSLTTPAGLKHLSRSKCDADLIEVRLDMLLKAGLTLDDLADKLESRWQPVLLTPRSTKEGGVYQWSGQKERVEALLRLGPLVEAIDIELAELKSFAMTVALPELAECSLVLSAHSIAKPLTPALLKKLVAAFKAEHKRRTARPLHVCKVAARVDSLEDLRALAGIMTESPELPWAVMGLGPQAMLSRQVLAGLGSKLVYGYLDAPAAPGQPSARELRKAIG